VLYDARMNAPLYIWHCESCGRQGESTNRPQAGDRILCLDCSPGLRAALGLPPQPSPREVLQELFDAWYQTTESVIHELGYSDEMPHHHLEAVRYALFFGLTPPDVEKHWIEPERSYDD
jgi:hypothetical protein